MATKSQHSKSYRKLPPFLRKLREDAGLTQRELGARLGKPHSWIYKCETGERRIDVTEFVSWVIECGGDPKDAVVQVTKLILFN